MQGLCGLTHNLTNCQPPGNSLCRGPPMASPPRYSMHQGLPSLACQPILRQPIGHRGAVVGLFADELNCARLTDDSWWTHHDSYIVTLVNMCNKAIVPVDCEVFGFFQDLISVQLGGQG